MARIRDSSVRDVVAASDMVEVVSGRTPLRRASGSRYTGRCPFHEEKTPSFSVNPVEKLYYCFGCGKGGDVISFVRETESLDFVGAVEWLAERFRVPIEVEEASPHVEAERRRRERLYIVLDQTAAYFERLLWGGDAGASVREYLVGRGLGEEIAKEFRLGLSPGRGLADKAKERGFTLDELKSAGLVTTRATDYFPQRLMFPLADARGRIVGFQARKLREDDPLRGKYVNSPEGDLFHKSAVLYGLHLAKAAIGKQDFAAVVEGNTDVIALRQAGFEPVVASMGTALTERQLRELGRMTKRLFLCFDADAAGQEATLRGMELAAAQGFDVKIVTLPRGQDPADAPEGFEDRLQTAESYLVYRVRLEIERSADRQEGFVRAREVLARAEDSPERQEALRLLADRLDLPRETLAGLAPARGGQARTDEAPRLLGAGDRLERDVLAACVASPALVRGLGELSADHFDSEENRRFRDALVSGRDDPDLTALRAELDARAAQEALDERTGTELLLRLRERKLKRDLDERRSRADDRAAGAPREGASGARRAHVAELAQQVAGLGVDVGQLRGGQILRMPTDGTAVCSTERGGERLQEDAEVRREGGCGRLRVGRQLLVANLDRAGRSASSADVAPPDPRCTPCVARRLELGTSRRLDPEPRIRAIWHARVVGVHLLASEPGLLEQRAGDVAAVADDVNDDRLGEGEWDCGDDVCQLGGLLDRTHGADEPDPARDVEDPAEPLSCRVGREFCQLRNGGLDRRDLAEVDESRKRADRAGEERRPGAGRAEDEDEPVVQASKTLAEARATPGREALRNAELIRGRVDDPVHRAILAAACAPSVQVRCETYAPAVPHRGEEAVTPYVLVAEGNITQDQYEESIRRLTDGATEQMESVDEWPVPGLLSHTAGQGPNGFRVVDVWESWEALESFGALLLPILADIGVQGQPAIYEAHTFVSA